MFSLYGNTSGTPLAVLGCPLTSMARSTRHTSETAMAAPTAKVSPTPAMTTSRCRRLVSTTTSTRTIPPGFAFRSDTGLQAAYTDPINPLFDAVSPQPLYSFAAGYTHVFSQNLVNYFNPAFSWYESLFGPSNFQKTLAAFPSCCKAAEPTPPSPPLEGSTIPGCKAGAPPAFSSMTILPGATALTNSDSAPIPEFFASTTTTSARARSPR